MYLQLEFLAQDKDIELVKKSIDDVKTSSDKVRKGLFARYNELAKMYLDLHDRFQILERNI